MIQMHIIIRLEIIDISLLREQECGVPVRQRPGGNLRWYR